MVKFVKRNIYIVDKRGDRHLIADKVVVADTAISRLKGLMFEKELKKKHAMILFPCSSIHMFFMRFPIDVIYADKDLNVVKICKNIKPWRVDLGHKKAKYTIELPAGTIKQSPEKVILE